MKNGIAVVFVFFSLLTAIFFYKSVTEGFVPMPGDLLVGSYLPWLEQKWGYQVGVPIKNPLISDVFSQFYIWKSLIAESYRKLEMPLWNQYSYSGYPLLANFHSGALYPPNIFFVLLGDIKGWTAFMIFGVWGSLISMYFLLRVLKYQRIPSLVGAITYAFSGFAITWMQFATAAQTMVWLPWIFILVERFQNTKRVNFVLGMSTILFLLVTSGHFQGLIFSTAVGVAYLLYKKINWKIILVSLFSGVLLSSIQLLPTLELFRYSIRNTENYIQNYNYGLIPLGQLFTLVAPDLFGNATTGNYWGFWNYHETLMYVGLFAVISLLIAISDFKILTKEKFFVGLIFVSLLLGTNNFLGKLIYQFRVPGLSTSAAGRIFMLFSLGMSVLVAYAIQRIPQLDLKEVVRKLWGIGATFLMIFVLFGALHYLIFTGEEEVMQIWSKNTFVSLKNLIWPVILLFGFLSVIIFLRKTRYFALLILVIVVCDLFRFGWKYLPFVKPELVFPNTESIVFLKNRIGWDRMDRENGEIMPPNTWAMYRFMSPSGYDPLSIDRYVSGYQERLNADSTASPSRYSELNLYNSKALGNFGVKYLWAIKRNSKAGVGGEFFNYKLDLSRWKNIYDAPSYAILENLDYPGRVRVEDLGGKAEVTKYSAQKIQIAYNSPKENVVIIPDAWYPGWYAKVNGAPETIKPYDQIFRAVSVPSGSGTVEMYYLPLSFVLGLGLTTLAIAILATAKIVGTK